MTKSIHASIGATYLNPFHLPEVAVIQSLLLEGEWDECANRISLLQRDTDLTDLMITDNKKRDFYGKVYEGPHSKFGNLPDCEVDGLNIFYGFEDFNYQITIGSYSANVVIDHKLRDDIFVFTDRASQEFQLVRDTIAKETANAVNLAVSIQDAIANKLLTCKKVAIFFPESWGAKDKAFTATPEMAELREEMRIPATIHYSPEFEVADVSNGFMYFDYYESRDEGCCRLADIRDITTL